MDNLLALRLLSRHFLLPLEGQPAHPTRSSPGHSLMIPKGTLESKTFDPESFLPPYPPELEHQDFSSLGLISQRLSLPLPEPTLTEAWPVVRLMLKSHPEMLQSTAESIALTRHQSKFETTIGSVRSSTDVMVSPAMPTCSVCNRPLAPFLWHQRDPHRCPQHALDDLLLQQAVAQRQPYMRVEQVQDQLRDGLIVNWRLSDYRWWDGLKSTLAPRYCEWRDRAISLL